jgi:hypothetical protein
MSSYYLNSLSDLKKTIQSIQNDALIQSLMVCVTDKSCDSVITLIDELNTLDLPFFGGIFPEIIVENQRKQEGFLIIPFHFKVDNYVVKLEDEAEIGNQVEFICDNIGQYANTTWIYVDCFSSNKTILIESLYQNLGYTFTYVGGGAGSLSFEQIPAVFNNTGIYKNAAVLAFADTHLSLGVAHGWSPISDKLKVTKTNGNNIISFDWKPAVEVYTSIVEKHAKSKFDNKGFFELAKSYPLGMVKVGGDIIVRDPIMIKDNELVIVDRVNEGEFVQILNGDMNSLLAGAKNAQFLAHGYQNNKNVFCIDCISRVLYMNDDFQKEIDIIKGNQTLNGVLTIGEIANNSQTFLEIYNKTTVVITW